MSSDPFAQPAARQYTIRPYNLRMAKRVARRAHVDGEGAVAVAFAFNNLVTTIVLGAVVDIVKFIPIIGSYLDLAVSIVAFYFHRIVLVTDENVYVYRDWPFHFPGKMLMKLERKPGVVQLGAPTVSSSSFMRFIRRGQLTFQDGTIVYHSFIFIRPARSTSHRKPTCPQAGSAKRLVLKPSRSNGCLTHVSRTVFTSSRH